MFYRKIYQIYINIKIPEWLKHSGKGKFLIEALLVLKIQSGVCCYQTLTGQIIYKVLTRLFPKNIPQSGLTIFQIKPRARVLSM